MVLPTLSRDTDLTETPAEPMPAPMLVAMAEPAGITPGTMQQNVLNPSNQTAQIKQEDYLGQQRKEEQLNNIDLHAVNQGIDLLNKYYPGLGQVTLQPIQQLLPANPLMARQWADLSQEFSQNQTSQTSRSYDANNTQINDAAKLEENSSKDSNETQKSKTDSQQDPGSSAAAPSTENNGQNKNKIYSNGSQAKVKGPKNRAQKHNEEKSNDAKVSKDFKQHGGWSPAYQRHMECVNNYKLCGGLAPQIAYDATRIALVIRGGYPLYQGATISTILTKKWLIESLKFLRRKFPQAAVTKAGTYLIENYTNFPEYVINKGEDFGTEIGNKICQ